MKKLTHAQLDEIIRKTLDGVDHDDGRYREFFHALQINIAPRSPAWVLGSEVVLIGFSYLGNLRRGVTARCLAANSKRYEVSAADVALSDDAEGSEFLAAYRRWMGLTPYLPAGAPKAKHLSRHRVELLFIAPGKDTGLRCRVKGSDQTVTLRLIGIPPVVPGETLTVEISNVYTRAGHDLLNGRLIKATIDAKALQLTPLQLQDCGIWDPKEHFWGEEKRLPQWAKAQQNRGPRPQYEMEQVLPGEDPDDMDSDPIIRAADYTALGQRKQAFETLYRLCDADLRCLDAHAHLGNLWFDRKPDIAIRHYEVGVRIGELSLGENFQGLLPWGLIDNRPFLRCMNGYGLCLWRLKRFEEAAQVFDRMLWLNPTDNQGVRGLIDDVRARRPWRDDD